MEKEKLKTLKEEGCGENLGAYMKIPKEYENKSDKIRNQHAYSVDIVCGKNYYCEICKIKIKHKQAVKEAYEEFLEDGFGCYARRIFKDKFGFEL